MSQLTQFVIPYSGIYLYYWYTILIYGKLPTTIVHVLIIFVVRLKVYGIRTGTYVYARVVENRRDATDSSTRYFAVKLLNLAPHTHELMVIDIKSGCLL